jgi:hypothetical protein
MTRLRLAALLYCVAFATACSWEPMPEDTANTRLALDFAKAMAAGETARAHGLLSSTMQAALTPETLGRHYQQMVEYGEGAPSIIQVMTTMSDWPAKEPLDTEWVYVAIANDTYSEAVTVVVTQEPSRLAIRSIEWGRP